jgi:hypothetical protein
LVGSLLLARRGKKSRGGDDLNDQEDEDEDEDVDKFSFRTSLPDFAALNAEAHLRSW